MSREFSNALDYLQEAFHRADWSFEAKASPIRRGRNSGYSLYYRNKKLGIKEISLKELSELKYPLEGIDFSYLYTCIETVKEEILARIQRSERLNRKEKRCVLEVIKNLITIQRILTNIIEGRGNNNHNYIQLLWKLNNVFKIGNFETMQTVTIVLKLFNS